MSEQANIISPNQPQQFQPQCSAPQMDGQIITQEQRGKEQLSCKSRLQHFTQKAKLSLPSYRTTHEQQTLMFRGSVEVDGETFTCVNTFSTRKAAEEAAAKLALESDSILDKIKNIGKINKGASKRSYNGEFPPIHEDRVFCKSILYEFAAKKNIDKPVYDTVRVDNVIPVYISSSVFDGVKYTGGPSGSKKEAEQLAARAAIQSILANSGSETILSDIVRSKAKFISALRANSGVTNNLVNSGTSVIKEIDSDNGQRGGDMTRKVSSEELQQSASKKARIPETVTESCIVVGNTEPNLETPPQPSLLPRSQTHPQPSFLPQPNLLQNSETLPQPSLLLNNQTLSQTSFPLNTQKQDQPSLHPSTQILPQPSLLQNSHVLSQPTLPLSPHTPSQSSSIANFQTLPQPNPLPTTFVPSSDTQIPSNETASSRRRKNKKANKKAKLLMQMMQASNVPLSQAPSCTIPQ